MNSKQAKTLKAVFGAPPPPANVEWAAIERLLVSVGCEIVEGSGSRVTFIYQGPVESFHQPHLRKKPNVINYDKPKTFW
jgi:hypothetical protein